MSEIMQNFPPAPEAQVTLANWRTGPYNGWAFHHVREIVPSADIAHDPHGVVPFQTAPLDVTSARVVSKGKPLDYNGFMDTTNTDGLVVLAGGKLVFEDYRNGMTPRSPHILMSVSKSLLGLLAGSLVERGDIDLDAAVETYVPEMNQTGYAGATIRHLLDMRAGVTFVEDYLATEGPIVEYRKATNWNPLDPGETPNDLRSFFLTLTERDGPHGGPFHYISTSTDLLAWVFERATGQRYADLMSTHFWSRIGAEEPAYVTVDRLGAPRAAGGMCVTTRDLARVGQLMLDGGRGIVPASWIEDIAGNGDPKAWDEGDFAKDFEGIPMHYRSKWYVIRGERPLLMCLGIHGQNLFIDRQAGLVVAKHASSPMPLDTSGERLTMQLVDAIRNML